MYYDEEQYYEPNAYEEIVMEYQQKMKEVLLGTIKVEMENTKDENARLKEENEKLRNEQSNIRNKEHQLEIQKSDLMRQVKRERLSQLMSDFQIVMYRTNTIYPKIPKCNKCDDNRKIKFTSPSDKQMEEFCSCDKGKETFIPVEYICTEFKVNRDDGAMLMWYKENHEKDYDWYGYNNSDLVKSVYKGEMFEKLDDSNTYFKSKELCQEYCDWLNKNKNIEVDNKPPMKN